MRYQYKFYPEKYFQLFFLLLLLTLSSLGNLQNLRFSHLTVDQGLSHTWVVDIIQDQYGFMWFATANGLNKYDGFNFEIYQHSQSDSSTIIHNFISHLFEDSRGNIWIGTPSGASRYNRNLDNFINYYSGTDSGSLGGTVVQTIIEDDQGTIWISTTGGLNAYNPESNRFTYYSYDDQEIRGFASSSSMGDMLVGPGGNIWIGTLGRGLTRFDKKTKTFTQFLLQNSDKLVHSNTSIESLAPCDDHHLWIGTHGNGLIKLDVTPGKEKPVKQYLNDVDNPLSIANNYIMSLQILADNKLWVGTENGGLDLFNPNNETFDHIKPMSNLAEGLNNGSIYSIYVDGQRNLWVGTYNGGVNVSFYSLQGMSVYRVVYG